MEDNIIKADIEIAGRRYFSRSRLAAELGVAKQTLACWAVQGRGPRRTIIGRKCLYPVEGVLEFLSSCERKDT